MAVDELHEGDEYQCKITISFMTEKEINELPEFEG